MYAYNAMAQKTPVRSKFEKYLDASRQWRWRFRAENGEIVASGEAYVYEWDCDRAIAIMQSSAGATVVDLTTTSLVNLAAAPSGRPRGLLGGGR